MESLVGAVKLAKQVLSQLRYTPIAGTVSILKHLQSLENSLLPSSVSELCQTSRSETSRVAARRNHERI